MSLTTMAALVLPIMVARSRRRGCRPASVDLDLRRARSRGIASSERLAINEARCLRLFLKLFLIEASIVSGSSCRARFRTRGGREGQGVAPAGGASHPESLILTPDIPLTIPAENHSIKLCIPTGPQGELAAHTSTKIARASISPKSPQYCYRQGRQRMIDRRRGSPCTQDLQLSRSFIIQQISSS